MIRFKRMHPDAAEPRIATDGSAGIDLASVDWGTIYPRGTLVCRLGWAVEIAPGHVGLLCSRSGHGLRGLRFANSVGVIDSDYRGELTITLVNDAAYARMIEVGERVAQLVVVPVATAFEIVDELGQTARGAGGHGSTGRI